MDELTYSSYLKIDDLLSLQVPRSDPPEHDEMLFIVIHQVYELWFKAILHEVEKTKRDFSSGDLFGALHTFGRIRAILKTAVGQLDILETMTPMSFSAFRDRLEHASGFQSFQFREMEFVMGYRRSERLADHPAGSTARLRLERRLRERSLIDHFYDFLETLGLEVPPHLRQRDRALSNTADETIQRGLLRLYRERPDVAALLERMTDVDEGFQEWRYRHIKVVERTIGNKKGTGGSLGVPFLKTSLFRPFFPDLWAIRHEL